jgi:hypothetical protein
MTFYQAVLTQNQWIGSFTPATTAGATTQSSTSSVSAGVPPRGSTLVDMQTLTAGNFSNANPAGESVAFITVVAAIPMISYIPPQLYFRSAPALLTRMPGRPERWRISLKRHWTASGWLTSAGTTLARPPLMVTSAATTFGRSS